MYKSLREDFQEVHKMHAPSQEHEQIFLYVLGLSIIHCFYNYLVGF